MRRPRGPAFDRSPDFLRKRPELVSAGIGPAPPSGPGTGPDGAARTGCRAGRPGPDRPTADRRGGIRPPAYPACRPVRSAGDGGGAPVRSQKSVSMRRPAFRILATRNPEFLAAVELRERAVPHRKACQDVVDDVARVRISPDCPAQPGAAYRTSSGSSRSRIGPRAAISPSLSRLSQDVTEPGPVAGSPVSSISVAIIVCLRESSASLASILSRTVEALYRGSSHI